ncbi:hypothetical protein [uncultured Brevibacillus sp.]|uniref:hypothetical protein n=1 Tax=uncultured Brevibacillus sp. TaxID=169970 RepID=UPI002594E4A9|nr:hypothetical protein [uncultured Brevibacillus sp.]
MLWCSLWLWLRPLIEAYIVGHDWVPPVAWLAARSRPDIFKAVAGLSVPFAGRGLIPLPGSGLTDKMQIPDVLPDLLTEEDVDFLVNELERTGLTPGFELVVQQEQPEATNAALIAFFDSVSR